MTTNDLGGCKKDFPLFSYKANRILAYMDNAATTQKPQSVIDAVSDFYTQSNANVHRGVYKLSELATEKFEGARDRIAKFVGAKPEGLVFTKGATEALNLAMYSWGLDNISKGDTIVLTEMEHHSNLVPWQQLAIKKKANLKYVKVTDFKIDQDDFSRVLDEASNTTKLVSFTAASNALGSVSPVSKMVRDIRKKASHAKIVLDATQAVPHMPIDFAEAGVDMMAFSSHKMLGPTGIGAFVARPELLESMTPFNYGGHMISKVEKQKSEWSRCPAKFEAGTADTSGVVGFGAAVDYVKKVGINKIAAHEQSLLKEMSDKLSSIKGVTLYLHRNLKENLGIVSLNLDKVHPHDVASILDTKGVAVRSGHHCAQVLMERLDVAATLRASAYIYNTSDDIDRLTAGIIDAKNVFSRGR